MKNAMILFLVLVFSTMAFCQKNEFKIYSNGLIYSEQTMNKLSHIVDSLNLQFRVCDPNKNFYAKQQTVAHVVQLNKGNIKAAKEDMEHQLPIDQFLAKYPDASVKKKVLVVKSKYDDDNDENVTEFRQVDLLGDGDGLSIQKRSGLLYGKDLQNKWLIHYDEESGYSGESLSAFYFPDKFTSTLLPRKYALMIGYSDCLVDTIAAKLKGDLEDGWVDLPAHWESLPHKEKDRLLDQMRSTRVVGGCSMDRRPREHAINIALLSAETANWDVFLKAHLDIMNDRFERVSDGSYAWGERNTYIKELEELNINVKDLILGTTFRIENSAKHHYYSNIGRVSRALSETKNRKEIEETMLETIADKTLDDYNRVIFYFLFSSYNEYIKDETAKQFNKEKLTAVIKQLPDYIYDYLVKK